MKPLHFNAAESIIEPFWDPELSEIDQWSTKKENAGAVTVNQTWCMVAFKWKNSVKGLTAFSISREYDGLVTGHSNRLIVSAALSKGIFINVKVVGDGTCVTGDFVCRDDKKHEYEIDISKINLIDRITLMIGSEDKPEGSGWLNWIGLTDSNLLEKYLETKNEFTEETWQKHLKPIDYEPEYKPAYGILINDSELESIRDRLGEDDNSFSDFDEIDDFYNPETQIGDFVNFLQDTRYNRERDELHTILEKGEQAAVAGLIYKDKHLMRLAARYALSIASCGRWDDGFICDFKTSSFNHRCFVQSLCLYECALILDMAGEMFTDTGRDYVLRRMAEEGIGSINFNTWKYEYIFDCNQMAWFSRGRMYGYAVLMEHYPRIDRYMDIALDDAIENINNTIESDGGYLEGPAYFSCVGRDSLQAIYIYARVRGIDPRSLIPDILAKTVVFGEVIESTYKKIDFIPICDSSHKIKPTFIDLYKAHLAFMAYYFKDSVWPDVFKKHVENYGLGKNPIVWVLSEMITGSDNFTRSSFINMEVTGHTVSLRKTKNGYAKILIPGNKAGAGHSHYDKGSFVFEYEGDIFLMDPGICKYDNPLSFELKYPERHNMLVPVSYDEIPLPENPLMNDMIPKATGNEYSFKAEMDLTLGWNGWYKTWKRSIISPSPEELFISDIYELEKGEGVNMILNSPFEIELESGSAVINGRTGRLIISLPAGCHARVESLEHPDTVHNRLMIYKESVSGILEIKMRMDKYS